MDAIREINALVKTAQLAKGDVHSFYGEKSKPATRRPSATEHHGATSRVLIRG